MRGFVFIDGSNFYFKLKQLSESLDPEVQLLDFAYDRFLRWLVSPNELAGARYYIGAVKQDGTDKAKRLYANQQRLFRKLQRHGIEIIPGHLIRHPDRTFHEKGVDVRLAVEMIRLAREDRYDQAYLLSSDTDLVPAVEEVRSFGKTVQYVGIPKGQSYGLSKTADDVRLLRPEEMAPFFAPAVPEELDAPAVVYREPPEDLPEALRILADFHTRLHHEQHAFAPQEMAYIHELLTRYTPDDVYDLMTFGLERAAQTRFLLERFGGLAVYEAEWRKEREKRGGNV